MLVDQKDEKAVRLLARLLHAAQRAQQTGKNLVLQKVLTDARKLTSILEHRQGLKAPPEPQHAYIKVQGEII